MRARVLIVIVAVLALLEVLAFAGLASAQSPSGAFEQLSPGNQKIVRSLFEAQRRDLPPGTRRLSLDEIATRKGGGDQGWGNVFKDMKAQGLLTEKNLGQVVSRHSGRPQTGGAVSAGNRVHGRAAEGAASIGHGRPDRISGGGGIGHGGGSAGPGGGHGKGK